MAPGDILVPALAAMCLLLSGCAYPGPYRTDADPQHQIVEHFDAEGYDVGYVEFDEQGWFWMPDNGKDDIGHREQMLKVQDMIVDAAQYDPTKRTAKSIILVAFVHGWRNNAAPDPKNNTAQFKGMLAQLAKDERAANPTNPRKVVGVYIGWPGLSADVEPLETLSFYSRKNAGDRVGHYGGVTEVLSRLESLNDSINEWRPSDAVASFYVVVGHSFGAQVVYNSVMGVMTQRVAERKVSRYLESSATRALRAASADTTKKGREFTPGNAPLQPFGDLVVLINPAFEGERYYNLKTFTEEFQYPPSQRPVLAIFCSETDVYTRVDFPIGRYISTLFDRYREGPLHDLQKETNLHTIPWTDEFVTHRLVTLDEYTKSGATLPAAAAWSSATRVLPWNSGGCVLYPNPGASGPWTPFYVVQVDKALMDGHNDIWEPNFTQFLEAFIAHADKKKAGDAAHRVMRTSKAPDAADAKPGP